jgi:mRNA-degrading endonuclease RelE of RelBE toxin-antitoxin system
MNYKIETTNNFIKEIKPLAKKYRSLKIDLLALNESLRQNPAQGVSLGQGCYKIRLQISSKGKGKSGGARVITCVKIVHQTIVMLILKWRFNL